MTTRFRSMLAAAALASLSGAALAHPGHAPASFATGFAHPLGGLDHLLAMLAVGLYAARQAGAARLLLPAGFVLAMLAGAGLGALGLALPAVEAGIAASLLVLGLLVALAARLPGFSPREVHVNVATTSGHYYDNLAAGVRKPARPHAAVRKVLARRRAR